VPPLPKTDQEGRHRQSERILLSFLPEISCDVDNDSIRLG
jgi:hypothetical protein